MSQWRRIAIQEMPSCKDVIERADTPGAMWCHLWDEFDSLLHGQPLTRDKIHQIYRFALWCSKNSKPHYLTAEAWLFFDYVIGACIVGDAAIIDYLSSQMSSSEFNQRVETKSYQFSKEKIDAAKKCFVAAQHKPK